MKERTAHGLQTAQSSDDPLLGEWMDRDELAQQLGICVATLTRWGSARQGPPFTKVGRRNLYRRESVRQWLRDREVQLERAMRSADR